MYLEHVSYYVSQVTIFGPSSIASLFWILVSCTHPPGRRCSISWSFMASARSSRWFGLSQTSHIMRNTARFSSSTWNMWDVSMCFPRPTQFPSPVHTTNPSLSYHRSSYSQFLKHVFESSIFGPFAWFRVDPLAFKFRPASASWFHAFRPDQSTPPIFRRRL